MKYLGIDKEKTFSKDKVVRIYYQVPFYAKIITAYNDSIPIKVTELSRCVGSDSYQYYCQYPTGQNGAFVNLGQLERIDEEVWKDAVVNFIANKLTEDPMPNDWIM